MGVSPCDFFGLKSEFRKEQLYFKNNNGNYEAAITLVELVTAFDDLNLYRRIEKPIEWWDDLVEYIERTTEDSGYAELLKGEKLHIEATMNRDQWCDFARILLEQNED